MGDQRPEGVGDQRRDRRRPRRDRLRRPRARLQRARRVHRADERDQRHLEGTKVSKHGLRASHTADVFLDDCRIPGGYVLGGKDKLDERHRARARGQEEQVPGGDADVRVLAPDRRRAGARVARAAYEYALEYAKEREQFGRKIVENQSIAFTLARMKLEIDAARLLVWRASWMGRTA